MYNVLKKETLPKIFSNQIITAIIAYIGGVLLTYKLFSPFKVVLSVFILYVYSYFIHRLFHLFPKQINIHMNFHHDHRENQSYLEKYVNLFVECISNILFFVLFYYIQRGLFIDYVPTIIIFYYGFIYTSIHIVNYSLFHTANSHVQHHENKVCNFGPDVLDHLFSTNCDQTIENYNHIIPNILVSFIVTYLVFRPNI